MNTQPPTTKTRLVRKAVVLLAAFALLAAACSGGETATEPTTTLADTSTDTGTDTDTADATAVDDDVGDGHDHSEDDGHDHADDIDATLPVPFASSENGGLKDKEQEAADYEAAVEETIEEHIQATEDAAADATDDATDDAGTAPADNKQPPSQPDGQTPTGDEQRIETPTVAPPANVPNTFSVAHNVGPDGVQYDKSALIITPRSAVINTHQRGDDYFFANWVNPYHPNNAPYEVRFYFNGRTPLEATPTYLDYTPTPPTSDGYVNLQQFWDDPVPIRENVDVRLRNTETGEVQHLRVWGWEIGAPGGALISKIEYPESDYPNYVGPRKEINVAYPGYDEETSRFVAWYVKVCHYGTDGVEFLPGRGRATRFIATEPRLDNGEWSGAAWLRQGRPGTQGWAGRC